jgi:hypothetical protein
VLLLIVQVSLTGGVIESVLPIDFRILAATLPIVKPLQLTLLSYDTIGASDDRAVDFPTTTSDVEDAKASFPVASLDPLDRTSLAVADELVGSVGLQADRRAVRSFPVRPTARAEDITD